MAFDNTNFLESATQANNGDFVFTNRAGTVDSQVQSRGTNGEWSESTTTTPSNGTGPSAPPTGRSGYIYTETTSPTASTTWAMRRDTSFDSTTQNVFLDLIYNLNGDTGSNVFIEYATVANPNETTDWTILETIAGTATDSWISDTFDFSAISTTTLHIRVRLSTLNDFTNDFAFSTWREYSVDTGGGVAADIHIGDWRGGTVSGVPTQTFAAAPLLTSEIRNDDSSYGFSFSNATLTLPSSGLSDGYLMIFAFEYEDTSNGRAMLNGRILQTSGTGNAIAPITGGYCRNTAEDRIYVRTWAFVDNPSASATFQCQWRRDADAPTGGTVRAAFEVISFYYDSVGLYSSTSTALYGGTTPNQIQGFSTVTEGGGMTRSGNAVDLNNNKRYLCLGAGHVLGTGNGRSQRWLGFRQNGTKLDYAKGYYYIRNGSNSCTGAMFGAIINNNTLNSTIDMFSYRGDGVASGQGGADADASTPNSAEYYMAIIELNNNTSCLQTTNGTTTTNVNNVNQTDMPSFVTTLVNIGSSFTNIGGSSNTTIEAAKDFDLLAGSNMSAASTNISTSVRGTFVSQFRRDTTLQNETFHGNYIRNNQGSQDTFGWSSNQISVTEMTDGQTFSNSVGRKAGSGGGGDPTIQSGWHGTWAIDLNSMAPIIQNRRIFSIT